MLYKDKGLINKLKEKLRKLFFPYFYCPESLSYHDFDWRVSFEKEFKARTGLCKKCGCKVVFHQSSDSSSEVWTDKDGVILRKETLYFTKEF